MSSSTEESRRKENFCRFVALCTNEPKVGDGDKDRINAEPGDDEESSRKVEILGPEFTSERGSTLEEIEALRCNGEARETGGSSVDDGSEERGDDYGG